MRAFPKRRCHPAAKTAGSRFPSDAAIKSRHDTIHRCHFEMPRSSRGMTRMALAAFSLLLLVFLPPYVRRFECGRRRHGPRLEDRERVFRQAVIAEVRDRLVGEPRLQELHPKRLPVDQYVRERAVVGSVPPRTMTTRFAARKSRSVRAAASTFF